MPSRIVSSPLGPGNVALAAQSAPAATQTFVAMARCVAAKSIAVWTFRNGTSPFSAIAASSLPSGVTSRQGQLPSGAPSQVFATQPVLPVPV
jgi:hypothetical protein